MQLAWLSVCRIDKGTKAGRIRGERPLAESQKLGVLKNFQRNRKLVLSVYVNDFKMVGRKESVAPMDRSLRKHIDLEHPTPFLNQVYWCCTERVADNDESASAGMKELFRRIITLHAGDGDKPMMNTTTQCDYVEKWKLRHGRTCRTCVEDTMSGPKKSISDLQKMKTPCTDDHQLNPEEFQIRGDLAPVCAQIVRKCLYLARIGRPDVLLSVNRCDKRKITTYVALFATESRLSNWVCSRTHSSRETCKITSLHLAAYCACSVITHLFQLLGCVKRMESVPPSVVWDCDLDVLAPHVCAKAAVGNIPLPQPMSQTFILRHTLSLLSLLSLFLRTCCNHLVTHNCL